jgi:multicomponent K+:H+ antiporter subunit G
VSPADGAAVLPLWVEVVVALLLVASGVFALIGGIGLVRLKDFFQRMHPPALASTLGSWCLALASAIHASVTEGRLQLHAWAIVVLLSITLPVTTAVLARAALFRLREAGADVPPPLGTEPVEQDEAAAAAPPPSRLPPAAP